jgi:CubicO group peptidase (beta-lactamase class C family)
MNRQVLSGCIWLLLCVISAARGQSTGELGPELDQKIPAGLTAAGAPSVSVAVIQNGHAEYVHAFGKADISKDEAATVETRYAVGSISKQFTAAGLLLEQEQGKLSLDDKVSKYYPDLTRANEVTIRELLSHTSGYEDYAPQDYLIPEWTRPITPDEILNRWAKKPLNFDPGTEWQYSNTNYVLAGRILEKVSGEELLPFLEEHFFRPLRMSSAGDCEVHNPQDATAYTRYALGPPRQVGREVRGWYFAAGELCMTAADLAKWDVNFLQKKILSAESYQEFTREVKLKNGKPTHYALGLSVGEFQDTPLISHGGEVSGFLAANSLLPAKNAGVVVLSNQDGVNLIGPLSQMIRAMLVHPPDAATYKQEQQVRSILEGLQRGQIDRAWFTANANSYFKETALSDYRNSLAPLGRLQLLTRQDEEHRGGMTYMGYRAHFQKNTVVVSIYLTADGKFEQFLVEEQL